MKRLQQCRQEVLSGIDLESNSRSTSKGFPRESTLSRQHLDVGQRSKTAMEAVRRKQKSIEALRPVLKHNDTERESAMLDSRMSLTQDYKSQMRMNRDISFDKGRIKKKRAVVKK